MAIYVVFEPRGEQKASIDARFVRDGFAFLAFLLPPLWFLYYRLWPEALLVLVVIALLAALATEPAIGEAGPGLALLFAVAMGLEANALRMAGLRRRGWREREVIEAAERAEAEIRYFTDADRPGESEPGEPPRAHSEAAVRLQRARPHPALGLLSYPGGR